MGLFTAQARDRNAGNLRSQGAERGPEPLAKQPFFIGINDPVGLNPTGVAFDPKAFTLYNSWERLKNSDAGPSTESRLAIGRGQAIFNTRPMTLTGVGGLNGQTFPNGVTLPETFAGTCTTCHDTPNAGNHSVKAPLNIGLTDPGVAPYLPVYTLRNLMTQDTVATTDPGRASDHRQVGGHRQVQGAGPARPAARAANINGFGRHARGRDPVLRETLQPRADSPGENRSARVSPRALTPSDRSVTPSSTWRKSRTMIASAARS